MAPDRLKLTRDAFDATMTDPAFVTEATRNGLAVEPVSGEQLTARVMTIYATPQSIIDKVTAMMK